jgi:Zn-dependent protease with chaperone function
MGLEMLASFYPVCTCLGSAVLLGLGGFVPVVRKWLRNEIRLRDARAVVHALGGVWLTRERVDPDADFGPVLQRCDAPLLFDEVEELSRRMGARPPSQTRLTYLPCCGVVAWGRRRQALLLGLPLLPVLSRGELRAVLAHELAHLARGDLRRLDRAAHFVERLGQGLEQLDLEGSRWKASSPLRAWARWNYGAAQGLRAPIVRGQEARADRAAATLAGGAETASALVKVAMVQPLFREVLVHYDAARGDLPNLFAFFRSFWVKMPGGMRMAMRHSLLCDRRTAPNPAHPHLLDRLSLVQTKPPRPFPEANLPATSVIGDLEAFEQMLHARLFATDRFEASIFHRAGS